MQTRQQCIDEFQAAMQAERELWAKLGSHDPSLPGFDRELWEQWISAVSRATAASKAVREAIADDDHSAPRGH